MNMKGEFKLWHNPGYDYLRLAKWMQKIDPNDPSLKDLPLAPYFLPILGILGACCAIEGYVNMVGKTIDSNWDDLEKGPIPIKKRISRVYDQVSASVDFGKGTWQRVLDLFKTRNELVHPRYIKSVEIGDSEIPTVFQRSGSKYPPSESGALAEEAIDKLLRDTNVEHLREFWKLRGYSGPRRD